MTLSAQWKQQTHAAQSVPAVTYAVGDTLSAQWEQQTHAAGSQFVQLPTLLVTSCQRSGSNKRTLQAVSSCREADGGDYFLNKNN